MHILKLDNIDHFGSLECELQYTGYTGHRDHQGSFAIPRSIRSMCCYTSACTRVRHQNHFQKSCPFFWNCLCIGRTSVRIRTVRDFENTGYFDLLGDFLWNCPVKSTDLGNPWESTWNRNTKASEGEDPWAHRAFSEWHQFPWGTLHRGEGDEGGGFQTLAALYGNQAPTYPGGAKNSLPATKWSSDIPLGTCCG